LISISSFEHGAEKKKFPGKKKNNPPRNQHDKEPGEEKCRSFPGDTGTIQPGNSC